MYSQNNEEEIIVKLFNGQKGRLLDIGAYDGKTFSNSYQLLLDGWKGVLVEPAPSVILSLINNTKDIKERVEIVNAAIVANKQEELLGFNDSMGDAVSTSDEKHYEVWKNTVNYRKVYVTAITVQDILRMFGTNYEFVNIDVEGQNLQILESIPFSSMHTKIVCVEHDYQYDRMKQIMRMHGLEEYHRNSENLIFKKI